MKPELYDYYYWQKVYDHGELKQLHDTFNEWHDENSVDHPAGGVVKTSKLKMAPWRNFRERLFELEQTFLKVNQDTFGYNIWPQFNDNHLILNEYDSAIKGEYDWHRDGSNNHTYDVKFTMLINASIEPYEGGRFCLFGAGGEKHVKELDEPGNVIVFKSNIIHKVYPVTKGKRHSIALFYSGPRFI